MKVNKSLASKIVSKSEYVSIHKRIVTRPSFLILWSVFAVYSYFADAPKVYDDWYSIPFAIEYFAGSATHYALVYYLMAYVSYESMIRNIPLLVSFLVFYLVLSFFDGVIFYYLISPEITATQQLEQSTSVFGAYFIGTVFLIVFFQERIRTSIGKEPDLIPIWWPVTLPAEDLLADLPENLRGKILRLHADNQYVEVVTENGQHLIRSTLADAIGKLNSANGHRVHRSMWIRRDQIGSVKYVKGSPRLFDTEGDDYPVSRAFYDEYRKIQTDAT